jgi:adenosylhomocysteine nucleosidase
MSNILIVSALHKEIPNRWEDGLENHSILYTGVGKVNATMALTKKFGKYGTYIPYDLVINYGTAGSRELPIGELVDCTKFIQRDMNTTGLGFIKGQTPFEKNIPIILDYDHVQNNPIRKKLRCGTGDNFVQTNEDTYSDVFDMEAYALAKVCYLYDVPFISFKYISDGADEHSAGDWVDNCSDGVREFKEKVLKELK